MHAYAKEGYLHSEQPTVTHAHTHSHTPINTFTESPHKKHTHTLTLRNARAKYVIILIYRQSTSLLTLSLLQCVVVCCSVLQCVAVCCSVLQQSTSLLTLSLLQCVAVCCSVFQCVATKHLCADALSLARAFSLSQIIHYSVIPFLWSSRSLYFLHARKSPKYIHMQTQKKSIYT